MFCPRCGTHNEDNAWRCIQCQADLHAPTPPGVGYGELTTSSKAVWSLVLGLLGLFCCGFVMGIIAIVIGLQAKQEIRENPGRFSGTGMATAGIALGIFDIVLNLIIPLIYFIFFAAEEGLLNF